MIKHLNNLVKLIQSNSGLGGYAISVSESPCAYDPVGYVKQIDDMTTEYLFPMADGDKQFMCCLNVVKTVDDSCQNQCCDEVGPEESEAISELITYLVRKFEIEDGEYCNLTVTHSQDEIPSSPGSEDETILRYTSPVHGTMKDLCRKAFGSDKGYVALKIQRSSK